MKYQTSFVSFSYQGLRDYQQDRLYPAFDGLNDTLQHIFAVCDGMGGTEQGEVASQSVVDTIAKMHNDLLDDYVLSSDALSLFLSQLYDQLDQDGKNIDTGTTLAMLWFHKEGCAMMHIGDSRIYQFRKTEGIMYRSSDHSLVNDLVEAHVITLEEAQTHPQRNLICRCMEPLTKGHGHDNATAMMTSDIQKGDLFFICSDGVLGEVSEESLTDIILSKESLTNKISTIAALCEQADDNATAILVEMDNVIPEKDDECGVNSKVEIDSRFVQTHPLETTAKANVEGNFLTRLFNKIFN